MALRDLRRELEQLRPDAALHRRVMRGEFDMDLEDFAGQGTTMPTDHAVSLRGTPAEGPPDAESRFHDLDTVHDATLTDLYTSMGRPEFNEDTRTYDLKVDGAVTGLTVVAIPNCDKARVVVAGVPVKDVVKGGMAPPLDHTRNTLDVVVTASDETTVLTYRVDIVREVGSILVNETNVKGAAVPSCALTSLTTTVGDLTYNPNTYLWERSVEEDEGDLVQIVAVPYDRKSGVEVVSQGGDPEKFGEEDKSPKLPLRLGEDNRFELIVTADDAKTKLTYFVRIERRRSAEENEQEDLGPCEGGCNHGVCNEMTHSCSCDAGWIFRDCSRYVANAYVLTLDHPDPQRQLFVVPSSRHEANQTDWGSTMIKAYGLRECTKALEKHFDPTTLPAPCKKPVNFCRRIMGAALHGHGDVKKHCEQLVERCYVDVRSAKQAPGVPIKDMAHCYFSVVQPRSEDSRLLAVDVCPGAVGLFIAMINRLVANVDHDVELVTVKPFAAPYSSVTINGMPVGVDSGESSPLTVLPGPNKFTIVVTAENRVTTSTYTLVVQRELFSQSNTIASMGMDLGATPANPSRLPELGSLRVTHAELKPAFNRWRHVYELDMAHHFESVAFFPASNSSDGTGVKSSVTVDGSAVSLGGVSQNIPVRPGTTRVDITVTAADAFSTGTYHVFVNRAFGPPGKSTDAKLKELSMVNALYRLDPPFHPDQFHYAIKGVSHEANWVVVRARTADPAASLRVHGRTVGSGEVSDMISIWDGPNVLDVVVTAADTTTAHTYRITVHRAAAPPADSQNPSSHATLHNIYLDGHLALKEDFSPENSDYTVEVDNDTPYVMVGCQPARGATVTVAGSAIRPHSFSQPIDLRGRSSNRLRLEVTAEDGRTKKTYQMTFIKGSEPHSMLVESIVPSLGRLEPKFSPSWHRYDVEVPAHLNEVDVITLTVTYASLDATVYIDGKAVVSGQPSQLIDVDRSHASTDINVTVVAHGSATGANATNTSIMYEVTVLRTSLARAPTDYFGNLRLYGRVPNNVDKSAYCRLDRCHAQILEGSMYDLPGKVFPPACRTALGQATTNIELAAENSSAWLAHFQCPMSAMCTSLKDCTSLMEECKLGLTFMSSDVSDGLRESYDGMKALFQQMDTEHRGFVPMAAVEDALANALKLEADEVETAVSNMKRKGRVSSAPAVGAAASGTSAERGLSLTDLMYNIVDGLLPKAQLGSAKQQGALRSIFHTFEGIICDASDHTTCPERMAEQLVKEGKPKSYADHVAQAADVTKDQKITLDEYITAVFTGVLPLALVDFPAKQDRSVLQSIVDEYAKSTGEEPMDMEKFVSYLEAQHDAGDAASPDVAALLFEACKTPTHTVLGLRDFATCALRGMLPMDALDPGVFGDFRLAIDHFRRAEKVTKSFGLTVKGLSQYIETLPPFQPAGADEKAFAKFISKVIDTSGDSTVSPAEFLRAVMKMQVAHDTKYGWLRLYEKWLLFTRCTGSQKKTVARRPELIHGMAKLSLLSSADAFFLAMSMPAHSEEGVKEEGQVSFLGFLEAFGLGLRPTLVPPYQPLLSTEQVQARFHDFDAVHNGMITNEEFARAYQKLGWSKKVAQGIGKMVAFSKPAETVREMSAMNELSGAGAGDIDFTKFINAFIDGQLLLIEVDKQNAAGPLDLMDELIGSTMTVLYNSPTDVRALLNKHLNSLLGDQELKVLVSADTGQQLEGVDIPALVSNLNIGLFGSWGALGSLIPQGAPVQQLRSMINAFISLSKSTSMQNRAENKVELDALRNRLSQNGLNYTCGLKRHVSALIVELLDADADGTLSFSEYAQGWRLRLIPRSFRSDCKALGVSLERVSAVYQEIRRLDTAAGGAEPDPAGDDSGAGPSQSLSLRALKAHLDETKMDAAVKGPLLKALADEEKGGISKNRFYFAALAGAYPLDRTEQLQTPQMVDAVKSLFKLEASNMDGAALTTAQITKGLVEGGYSEGDARLVVKAIGSQGKDAYGVDIDRITVWMFARAVFAGLIPIDALNFQPADEDDLPTNRSSASGAPASTGIGRRFQALNKALATFKAMGPDDKCSLLRSRFVEQLVAKNYADEIDAAFLGQALDRERREDEGSNAGPGREASVTKLRLLSTLKADRLISQSSNRRLQALQALIRNLKGQTMGRDKPTALGGYFMHYHFDEGDAGVINDAVLNTYGGKFVITNGYALGATVADGLLPFKAELQEWLILYSAVKVWRTQRTDKATTTDLRVESMLREEGLAPPAAKMMVDSILVDSSFPSFFDIVRAQVLPLWGGANVKAVNGAIGAVKPLVANLLRSAEARKVFANKKCGEKRAKKAEIAAILKSKQGGAKPEPAELAGAQLAHLGAQDEASLQSLVNALVAGRIATYISRRPMPMCPNQGSWDEDKPSEWVGCTMVTTDSLMTSCKALARSDDDGGACESYLVGTLGLTADQARVLVADEPSASDAEGRSRNRLTTVLRCIGNSLNWDCRMVLTAFATYAEAGGGAAQLPDTVPTKMVRRRLEQMDFDEADAIVISEMIDANQNGVVGLNEWMLAWERKMLPMWAPSADLPGSSDAWLIRQHVKRLRQHFNSEQCASAKDGQMTLTAALGACWTAAGEKELTEEDKPTLFCAVRHAVACRKDPTACSAEVADEGEVEIDEDTFVFLVMVGLLPAPAVAMEELGKFFNAVQDEFKTLYQATEAPGAGGQTEFVAFPVPFAEQATKAGVDSDVATLFATCVQEDANIHAAARKRGAKALDSGVTFTSFLRQALQGIVPVYAIQGGGHANQYDYTQLAKVDGVKDLESFKWCYFNRRLEILGTGDGADTGGVDVMALAGAATASAGEANNTLVVVTPLGEKCTMAPAIENQKFSVTFEVQNAVKWAWFFNDLEGPTTTTGTISKVATLDDAGDYRVVAYAADGQTEVNATCLLEVVEEGLADGGDEGLAGAEAESGGGDGDAAAASEDAELPNCPVGGQLAQPDLLGELVAVHVTNRNPFVVLVKKVGKDGSNQQWLPLADHQDAGLPPLPRGVPLRAIDESGQIISEFANPTSGMSARWEIGECNPDGDSSSTVADGGGGGAAAKAGTGGGATQPPATAPPAEEPAGGEQPPPAKTEPADGGPAKSAGPEAAQAEVPELPEAAEVPAPVAEEPVAEEAPSEAGGEGLTPAEADTAVDAEEELEREEAEDEGEAQNLLQAGDGGLVDLEQLEAEDDYLARLEE